MQTNKTWLGLTIALLATGPLSAQQLVLPAGVPGGDRFGEAVDVDGDTAAVGLPINGNLGQQAGMVRVLRKVAGVWAEEAALTASNGSALKGFGTQVAVSGDLMAACDNGSGDQVHVFARTGTTWAEEAILSGSSSSASSVFGFSVDFDGQTLVVGAPNEESTPGNKTGVVYVFERSNGAWSETGRLVGGSSVALGAFGGDVAISGDVIAVSAAPQRVFFFGRSGGGWAQEAELASTGAGQTFTGRLALSGDRLLVSGPNVVYARAFAGGVWSDDGVLTQPDGVQPGLLFGTGLGLSGDVAAVGRNGFEEGSVFLYTRRSGSWEFEREYAPPQPSNQGSSNDMGSALGLCGADLLMGIPGSDDGAAGAIPARGLAFDPASGEMFSVNGEGLATIAGSLRGDYIGDTGFVNVQGLAYDAAAGVLYASETASDNLLALDTATGVGTIVGYTGSPQLRGLAFDPNAQVLYGSDSQRDELLVIDRFTGQSTVVGPLGWTRVEGLAYDATADKLFGLDRETGSLLEIDTSTGLGTAVGSTGLSYGQGLAFDAGTGSLRSVENATSLSATSSFNLFEIDPLTATGTDLGPLIRVDTGLVLAATLDLTSTYCTAGTSASGCAAAISAVGTASATQASGFVLDAAGAEGAVQGLFFFGSNGRQASSWGNGTSLQCVVPPVRRAGLLTGSGTSGACDGGFSQDLNALWCPTCPKPGANPGPGVFVQAQLWYRDPASTSNQTTSLSDAIEFLMAP